MNRKLTVLAIAFGLTCSITSAQEPADSQADDNRGIDILTLIDRVAEETGREFIVDPRARGLRGISTNDVSDYDDLLGILRVNGLFAVETADQILILPEAVARSMPTRILQQDDPNVSDHEIVTRIVRVPDGPATNGDEQAPRATLLVPVLRPMMPQSAQLAAVPELNALVLVDRYDNVRRMTDVIEQIFRNL